MTQTGDREIRSVSGRLPDNPGELARMQLPPQMHHSVFPTLLSKLAPLSPSSPVSSSESTGSSPGG